MRRFKSYSRSYIFGGIGELFVIRSLGNFVGENELGAIEYAIDHLWIDHVTEKKRLIINCWDFEVFERKYN